MKLHFLWGLCHTITNSVIAIPSHLTRADDSDSYSVYGVSGRGRNSRSPGTAGGFRRANSTKCLVNRISGDGRDGNGSGGASNATYVIEDGVRKRLHEIPVTSSAGGQYHRLNIGVVPFSVMFG